MKLFPLIAIAALFSLAAFAESKVFSGFTLIDGNGGTPLADAAMIVTDGKISWVGPKANLKAPKDATVVDLKGKYIMPGIINQIGRAHV